jgi:hypothetical protein
MIQWRSSITNLLSAGKDEKDKTFAWSYCMALFHVKPRNSNPPNSQALISLIMPGPVDLIPSPTNNGPFTLRPSAEVALKLFSHQ